MTIMTQMTRKILRKKYRHNRHLPSQMADWASNFTRGARERENVVLECNEHRKCTASVYCTERNFLRILTDTIGTLRPYNPAVMTILSREFKEKNQ